MAQKTAEKQLAAESERGLEERLVTLEEELERRKEAERAAYDFYQLLANGSKEEVVERFPEVQGSLIDRATVELFRREVDRIRQELANEAYSKGTQAFDDEEWEKARDALLSSLSYQEFAPYTPELHFELAESLYQLEDHAAAARYYNLAIESNQLGRDKEAAAYYHRAESLRNLGRDREALRAFRAFVEHFPNHPWRSAADARASMLANRVNNDDQ
jgi:tetratricopeptide (TPR) repeat protein